MIYETERILAERSRLRRELHEIALRDPGSAAHVAARRAYEETPTLPAIVDLVAAAPPLSSGQRTLLRYALK